MLDVSLREHPTMTRLRESTSTHELANMQVAPEQAQFLQLLLRLINANLWKRVDAHHPQSR